MYAMADEIEMHLKEKLFPFWESLKDGENGGYYGYKDYDLAVDLYYEKGCILNSRILWFFSNGYLLFGEEHLREAADHAYSFMMEHCLDHEYGGVFWSVEYDGRVKDSTKHTYNQAFAIYALSSYSDAVKDVDKAKADHAKNQAIELFHLIEDKCTDEYGYLEAFDRTFQPAGNDKLSENGVLADKTMNTLLHVLEAYTELYRVSHREEVAERMKAILTIFQDKIFNKALGRQEVFFDKEYHTLIDLYSYGHDIEAAWLIDRALDVLGDAACKEKMAPVTKTLAEKIYEHAFDGNSVLTEAENGVDDMVRVWWVQAESIVGFINEGQKCSKADGEKYFQAAESIWKYIKTYFIDKREGSEWFWSLKPDGMPVEKPIVEPWKCPYHNGRMCMEVVRRLKASDS